MLICWQGNWKKLISKTKIDIYKMNVLPANWKELYDKILFL